MGCGHFRKYYRDNPTGLPAPLKTEKYNCSDQSKTRESPIQTSKVSCSTVCQDEMQHSTEGDHKHKYVENDLKVLF